MAAAKRDAATLELERLQQSGQRFLPNPAGIKAGEPENHGGPQGWTPLQGFKVGETEGICFVFFLTCSKCSLDGYLTPHEVFVLLDLYTLDCWVNIRSVL